MNEQVQQVQTLLKLTFGLVPIVAGLDKFLNLLTDWTQYASGISDLLPFEVGTFMAIVGIIEIAAGFLVLVRPKIGSLVVAGWLVLIAIVLLIGGRFDVAVRDLVMAIAAFCLFKLSLIENKATS